MSRPDPSPAAVSAPRLHVITGKGGTGKTTVAAALATAMAARGKRVLVCEVEGRQGLSQVFDVPPLAEDERQVARGLDGGEVIGLSIDPKTALLEYLQMFYKLGRAGGLLEKFGVIDFATTIAPGVRDVLLIGKVYEAVRRSPEQRRGAAGYDAVVLDAPPSGRIGRFLNVNHEVAGLAKVGPVRQQAQAITRLLRSNETVVHVVTLLEEMPVQETIEVVAELRSLQFAIGSVIINQERESPLDAAAVVALGSGDAPASLGADLTRAGLAESATVAEGLWETGRDLAARLDLQAQERAELERLGLPLCPLPLLAHGADAGGLREWAAVLTEHGLA